MPLAFKKDDQVVQNITPIEGVVIGPEIVDGEVKFRVAYTSADGEAHERLFAEDEIRAKE
jgi:hypothetical protein